MAKLRHELGADWDSIADASSVETCSPEQAVQKLWMNAAANVTAACTRHELFAEMEEPTPATTIEYEKLLKAHHRAQVIEKCVRRHMAEINDAREHPVLGRYTPTLISRFYDLLIFLSFFLLCLAQIPPSRINDGPTNRDAILLMNVLHRAQDNLRGVEHRFEQAMGILTRNMDAVEAQFLALKAHKDLIACRKSKDQADLTMEDYLALAPAAIMESIEIDMGRLDFCHDGTTTIHGLSHLDVDIHGNPLTRTWYVNVGEAGTEQNGDADDNYR